jgi:3'-phosphoadenosine 5'-phosphosulfate (PAPS) 3'-phosphatase
MDYRPFIERMLREASDIARQHAGNVTGWAKDGDNGAYASSRGMIWDCVAPHIVIEEAGGVFT